MGDGGEGETKKTHKHQKVRFNSACNETHVLEREVSSASSSSDLSNQSSSESTITDNDLANSDTISLDSSPHSSGGAGYDPNRIPSSVFNSAAPGNDWSVASNDSLFSITMGNNNSFSRDQGFLVYKSGELMKLDEVFNLPVTLPPVAEGAAVENGVEEDEDDDVIKKGPEKKKVVDLDGSSPSPKEIKIEDHCKPKLGGGGGGGDDPRNSVRVSDGSAASNSSFAFPILISQDTKNASNKSERTVKQEQSTVSRPQQQSEKKKSSPPPPPPPAPPKTRTLTSWFCCFNCCSFRCSMSLK